MFSDGYRTTKLSSEFIIDCSAVYNLAIACEVDVSGIGWIDGNGKHNVPRRGFVGSPFIY